MLDAEEAENELTPLAADIALIADPVLADERVCCNWGAVALAISRLTGRFSLYKLRYNWRLTFQEGWR